MDTANFIRADNIGASIDGAPALNVYSKFTYQNVEYSLAAGKAFLFCRGVGCSNKTRIGVTSSDAASPTTIIDRYNENQYTYSSERWSHPSFTPPPDTFALSPANAELQAKLAGTDLFDMEWIA